MLDNTTAIKPKISVIMPFYNAERFLAQAIESILNQTFSDFELILINDASTDSSGGIVQKYLNDSRITHIKNQKNRGIVYNLNRGLKIAQAEIIARMDGDDSAEPERFEEQFRFLEKNPEIAVVGCFVKIIDDNDKIIDQRTKPTDPAEIRNNLLVYSPVVHPTVMFRQSAVKKVGGYRPDYIYVEDVDLWYRLVYSGYKISNLPEFLFKYRYHPGSTAHNSTANARKAYQLRKETIKKFRLRVTLKQKFLIYIQLLVGILVPGRQRQFLEGWYKKIIYHEK